MPQSPTGRISLKPTLLFLVPGAVVVTSAVLFVVSHFITSVFLERLIQSRVQSVSSSISHQISETLNPAVSEVSFLSRAFTSSSAVFSVKKGDGYRTIMSYLAIRLSMMPHVRELWLVFPDRTEIGVQKPHSSAAEGFVLTPSGASVYSLDGHHIREVRKLEDESINDSRPWLSGMLYSDASRWSEVVPLPEGGRGLVLARRISTGSSDPKGALVAAMLDYPALGDVISSTLPDSSWWLMDASGKTLSSRMKPMMEGDLKFLKRSLDRGVSGFVSTPSGASYVLFMHPLTSLDGWKMGVVLPCSAAITLMAFLKQNWLAVSVVLFLAFLLLVWLVLRALSGPINYMKTASLTLEHLDFSQHTPPENTVFSEMAELVASFGRMYRVLRILSRYVPLELVRQVLKYEERVALGGRARRLTIMFTDIEDFTSISESTQPQQLTEYLGEYFQHITDIIHSQRGMVDKFIGDGVMAFWGAPTPVPDPPRMACEAALECKKAIVSLDSRHSGKRPPFRTRFGIHEGMAIVGNVGSPTRFNYTALGDSVSLASRLEGLNKLYGTEILISQEVYERVRERMECMLVDRVEVRGHEEPVLVYELMGLRGEVPERQMEAARFYEDAFKMYSEHRFEEAAWRFRMGAEQYPEREQLFNLFALRAMNYVVEPPEGQWDGVFRPPVR